jgi:hypothetical protein
MLMFFVGTPRDYHVHVGFAISLLSASKNVAVFIKKRSNSIAQSARRTGHDFGKIAPKDKGGRMRDEADKRPPRRPALALFRAVIA